MFLADEDANGRSAREAPVAANEVQFRFDIIDQKRHIVREVKIRDLKDQRVAENRLARDPIDFTGTQCTHRTCRAALRKRNGLVIIITQ